jgi:hypothetical protein
MTDKLILDKIIDLLEGSCDSLNAVCDNYDINSDDLSQADLEYIDEHIFCCSNCCWWFESGTQDEDGNCEDCQNE